MIVQCNTVEEFLECLKSEQHIFQNTVRVSTTRRPLDSGPPYAVFEVSFHASSVILVDTESQYLLQMGVRCEGKDYEDSTQSKEGSELADEIKNKIKRYVESRGWMILPGIISI